MSYYDSDEEQGHPEPVRRWFPNNPHIDPMQDFRQDVTRHSGHPCFTHRRNRSINLIYVDGCCYNNGRRDALGGWGVHIGMDNSLIGALPLDGTIHTNNRAELQAAIVALQHKDWQNEGFKKTVIATDSEYLVKGASEYYKKWTRNGWINAKGGPVKNVDLWHRLLNILDDYERSGSVFFYLIPREFNEDADELAKQGANLA